MTPIGIICKSELYGSFVALVLAARLLPGPDNAEARAYRAGFAAGLAAAAAACGLIQPGASLETMLLQEGRQ